MDKGRRGGGRAVGRDDVSILLEPSGRKDYSTSLRFVWWLIELDSISCYLKIPREFEQLEGFNKKPFCNNLSLLG